MVFVVTLTYTADLDRIDAVLPAHVEWLDAQYADGVFVASGRQVPRTGGVILAITEDRESLRTRLDLDPFHTLGLATHTVTEFIATRVAPGLEQLQR